MKANIERLTVLVVITVMATFILTAVASAGSLKTQGQFVSTGSGSCLLAMMGFNAETGVPNGATNGLWLIQTFTSEGVWTFERNGTGSFTGLNRSVTLPYNPPSGAVSPSVGVHSVSFDFHYTVADGIISITADQGTYVIEWIYGPSAPKSTILTGFQERALSRPTVRR